MFPSGFGPDSLSALFVSWTVESSDNILMKIVKGYNLIEVKQFIYVFSFISYQLKDLL